MANKRPLFEMRRIGDGRISLAAGLSAEQSSIYGNGYEESPTALETEYYAFANLLKWSLVLGFISRKELE